LERGLPGRIAAFVFSFPLSFFPLSLTTDTVMLYYFYGYLDPIYLFLQFHTRREVPFGLRVNEELSLIKISIAHNPSFRHRMTPAWIRAASDPFTPSSTTSSGAYRAHNLATEAKEACPCYLQLAVLVSTVHPSSHNK